MERKIFACVELKAKEDSEENDISLFDQICCFSLCEVMSCFYEYPLKIILPVSVTDSYCQWLYPMVFGGGLVEGDEVNISIKVRERCCLLVATLSFPKVYCCENGLDTQQHGKYLIENDALLCVLPDPLVCYKNASYVQTQAFYLTSRANLVVLDWYTSGRYARGEKWAFSKMKCVSSVFINDKLAFKESQHLQNTEFLSIDKAMKPYNILGICMLIGPLLIPLSHNILSVLGKCSGYGEKRDGNLIISSSPLYLNNGNEPIGCIIRFASLTVSNAIKKVEELLQPLFVVLGGNPFQNK